jgi:hypothetical protein
MLFNRLARFFVFAVALFVFAGCSSSSDSGTGSSGTSGSTPGAGPAFRGTLTGKGESGVVDVTLPAGAKIASINPLADEPATTSTVVATINLGGGKTINLTGTWNDATKTLSITGGGYTLTGTLTGSTLSGTYMGPNGAGSFALQAAVTGAVNVFCGTYMDSAGGSGAGTWNLVQGADNKLSGSYTANGGNSGLLTGTLTGDAIALTPSGGGFANGTLAGDNITGTYGTKPGENKGTWTGSKGNCAK